jgi:hypothetical protein
LKDMQYNNQSKGINDDLQNTTQKTKDWATRTPLRCCGRVDSSCSTCDTGMLQLNDTNIIWYGNCDETSKSSFQYSVIRYLKWIQIWRILGYSKHMFNFHLVLRYNVWPKF